MARAGERTTTDLVAYCLMGNHFHLVVHCPESGVSDLVHDLCATYVRRFNRAHGFDGPLFRSRFRSRVVVSDLDLIGVTRYVHRNPLDIGYDPLTYPWSSYGSYVGAVKPPPFLRTSVPLALVGGPGAYRHAVEEDIPADSRHYADGIRQWGRDATCPTDGYSLRSLDDAVAKAFGVDVDEVRRTRPGTKNPARAASVLLALDLGRFEIDDVADWYGFTGASGVRAAATRSRRRLESDGCFAERVADVRRLVGEGPPAAGTT